MFWTLGIVLLSACRHQPIDSSLATPHLPASLAGHAVVLAPDDPDAARAGATSAVKPPGQGGLTEAVVVRLTADVPVWRAWSGPEKKDSRGNTNRIGQWWSADAPHGTRDGYRRSYEICVGWNDLTWMAKCTLHKGAVVTVGPGQSVSAETCASPDESYPANPVDWQLFIATAWTRIGPDKELDCPDPSQDQPIDPADLDGARQP